MKFHKTIGHTDDPKVKALIREAEEKLSSVFTELSLGFDNKSLGSGLGGDPLVFQLVYPLPHYVDITAFQIDEIEEKIERQKEREERGEIVPEEEKVSDEVKAYKKKLGGRVLRTAATSGASFFWNPEFVCKLSRIGLRIVVYHESYHALYCHVSRRGSRLPKLYNIAIDFKVNFSAMEDLRAREVKDYPAVFTKELGEYIHLEEYAAFLRDPFHPPPRLAHLNPTEGLRKMADPAYVDPYGDVGPMYYADEALSDDMKRPENIYEYLYAQIPKCPVCGRLGKYKKPEEYKALQKKIEEQEKKKAEEKKSEEKKQKEAKEKREKGENEPDGHSEKHEHGDGESCNHPGEQPGEQPGQSSGQGDGQPAPGQGEASPGQADGKDDGSCCGGGESDKSCDCPGCGGDDSEYIDPFGAGETLDDHIDSDVSEEDLQKRIYDATQMAKRMAGRIPGALEDELNMLSAPLISWEDIVRQQMTKKRNGYGRSDWLNPRSRPMFAGLYVPKKRDFFLNVLCAYDCSGSMSSEDIAYGVSQLQVIDDRGELYLCGWDTQVYWETMIKIKKADAANLQNAVVKGRGGTHASDIFNQYEEHCGKLDMIIVITDGFLYDSELNDAKRPPKETETLWLVTSHNPNFKPPFGRVLHLRNEKL